MPSVVWVVELEATLALFWAGIDVLRERTLGMSLRDIIAATLEHSGLITHYKADREGADRVETLKNWSTRPRVLSPSRVLARTWWRCRWMNWASH